MTPIWIALDADKRPVRKGQLDGPSAIAPATPEELAAAPLRGVVPRSLGLVLVDIDSGDLAPDDRVASMERALGPALAKHPSRRDGGWHLWYAADCDFTLGRFDLAGRVVGDVKHDRQYGVVYDRDALDVAASKTATVPHLTELELRTLCNGDWTAGNRHYTMLKWSWAVALNGQEPAPVARIAREAGLQQGEIDRAMKRLPAARLGGGRLKLSQRDWAHALLARHHLCDMDGKLYRFNNMSGWRETSEERAAELAGDLMFETMEHAELKTGQEVFALLSADFGGMDVQTQRQIVKNCQGLAQLRKEYGGIGYMKAVAQYAGRIAAERDWNSNALTCGLPGARKVDLRTGEISFQSPDDRVSLELAALPAETPDPRWLDGLRAILCIQEDGTPFADAEDRLRHFQKLCGAMLIGRPTEDIVILKGGEGTGKSTLQDAIVAALGSYAVATNGDRLVGSGDSTHDAWKMPLKYARCLSVAEMPDTGRGWRGHTMKAVTSGDLIEASWKGKDPVRFRPMASILVSCNTMPAAYGQLVGLKRRFSIYELDREQPYDGSKDVLTGADLRPTVVRWLLDGARLLLADGLLRPDDRPESVAEAVARWHADNDAVAMFLADAELIVTGEATDYCALGWLKKAMTAWARQRDISVRGNLLIETLKAKPYRLTTRRMGKSNITVAVGITHTTLGNRDAADDHLPF